MDSVTLSSISTILGILAPVCMGGLFLWVVLRTRSRHTLFFRMWQLLHGNQEISDPAIRAYVSEQNSLMTFRFIAGVPVKTLESAHRLIEWTKLRNVDMFVLRIAGDYFDPDLRQIRIEQLPYKVTQWTKATLAALSAALVFLSLLIAFTSNAILTVNITDRWLLMTSNDARPLWPLMTKPIQKATCSDETTASEKSKFTTKEVAVLCEVLKNESTPNYIAETVKKQRSSATFLIIVTGIATLILLSEFVSGYVAARLARRKLDPSLDGDQLTLDLKLSRLENT
jgi:hypothetical protein